MKDFVEELWQVRDTLSADSLSQPELKKAILDTIDLLDTGKVRAVFLDDGKPTINEWVKKAILIYIQATACYPTNAGIFRYYDKIPMKFDGWDESRFKNSGVMVLPGSVARKGSFIGANSQILPSFIDIGAHIGRGAKIGTGAHIGACVQIGEGCTIGNHTAIEGALNPFHQLPAFIGDNCHIGSKCEIGAGVWVEDGCELLDGVFLTPTTRLFDLETETITYGRVPPYSVVSPGTLLDENGMSASYAAIITERKE